MYKERVGIKQEMINAQEQEIESLRQELATFLELLILINIIEFLMSKLPG